MSESGQGKNEDQLLTKREAASFFKVTERTFDRWLAQGHIPAEAKLIIGGAVRFRMQVLRSSISTP